MRFGDGEAIVAIEALKDLGCAGKESRGSGGDLFQSLPKW